MKITEAIIKDAQVSQCKRVDTPAVKFTTGQLEAATELDPDSAHRYRTILGKLMYVAWDRPDIQFGTGSASRGASGPTTVDEMRVKRLARYLTHRKVLKWRFRFNTTEVNNKIEVYTDSDWAGDIPSRRSTSGGILCYEGCVIKTWSTLQKLNALSSVDAEYLAMIKGVHEALALRTALLELGVETYIKIYTDSAAAKAMQRNPG